MKLQNGATPLKWALQSGNGDEPLEFGTVLARTTNAELVVWSVWREEPDADFLCTTGDYYCHDYEGANAQFNHRSTDYPFETYTVKLGGSTDTATKCHLCGVILEDK